jgi:heme O synthase-like polyprenyltransferase
VHVAWCLSWAHAGLIGWTGATVKVNAKAWLFLQSSFCGNSLIFWRSPLCTREDYARAGYKMLPRF